MCVYLYTAAVRAVWGGGVFKRDSFKKMVRD